MEQNANKESFLKDFDSQEEVIQNDQSVLESGELGIYIPSKKIAIEFNGLYQHSEINIEDKKYHVKKWKECKEKDIRLIQIFEDQWKNKPEVVKSIIRNALGKNVRKVFARKTILKDVPKAEAKIFFDNNHLDGYSNSMAHFGLYLDDELVSCIAVRTPFTKRNSGFLEVSRFASLINTSVTGGFSKLMVRVKEYMREKNYKTLLTYADLKLGSEGKVYEDYGFEFQGYSIGEYWYTDMEKRYNRFRYRAQDGMTEKEYAKSKNVVRIYGVGSAKYILKLE